MNEEERAREQGADERGPMRQRTTAPETLRRTSLQLTSSLDLPTVLDSVAQSAQALVGASDCLIYVYDEQIQSFSFGTARGRWAETGAVVAPRPDGLTATVARKVRPVIIDDATDHPLYASP